MLRILAVESATDWLSVALLEGEEIVGLKAPSATRQHAGTLLPTIDALLSEAGWSLSGIDALGISTGPGSFTSLRIGLATVKGLAFGREFQAVGVSTLEAMALSCLDSGGAGGASPDKEDEVVALLDARRGEWYAGAWSSAAEPGGVMTVAAAEGLYSPEALAADLPRPVRVICPEPGDWAAEFASAGLGIASRVEGEEARPRADWVGRLAARQLAAGEGIAPEALTARYLRRAEAEAKRLGGPVEAGEIARVEDSAQ
ncbi:MAG: tRNA (adenosine(37)-N6)-threonylcarbamoyltransferase complex dimerization subunit type 1 TsaB [Myxococcota bacterium]